MMKSYVLDALRTQVVPSGGKFNALIVSLLAAPVIKSLIERQGISPYLVNQLIMGNTLNAGSNQARLVALKAGLSEMTYATTIDTNQNSGIDSIILASEKIRAGSADLIIAGGAESSSRRPIKAHRPMEGGFDAIEYDETPSTPWLCASPSLHESAESIAIDGDISEQRQADWVQSSVDKAIIAKDRLKNERLKLDEFEKEFLGEDLAWCSGLDYLSLENPADILSQITSTDVYEAPCADGAGFVLMASERWVQENQVDTAVELVATSNVGSAADAPSWGVIDSCRSIMEANSMETQNFSVIELAETYAAQALFCIDELGLDEQKINMAGGDLARGNTHAASSAIMMVRLFHELKARQKGDLGLATCAGAGGIGSTAIMQAC